MSALHQDGPSAQVAGIMERNFITVYPESRMAELYTDLIATKQGVFPVLREGHVVGLLTGDDVGRYLMVQRAQRGRHDRGGPGSRVATGSRFTIDLG